MPLTENNGYNGNTQLASSVVAMSAKCTHTVGVKKNVI
jgi:hypothetical protein